MPHLKRPDAEKFFAPYFDDLCEAIVQGAEKDYQSEYSEKARRQVHDASLRAHCRQRHMLDRLALLAAENIKKIQVFESEGLLGVVIENKVALVAKKLDTDLRTRNNMTSHFERYLNQGQLTGIDALHNFVIGYTEDPLSGQLTGVYLVYPKSKYGRYYEFELTGKGGISTVFELFPAQEDQPTINPIGDSAKDDSDQPTIKPAPGDSKRDESDQPTLTPKKAPAEVLKFTRKDDGGKK